MFQLLHVTRKAKIQEEQGARSACWREVGPHGAVAAARGAQGFQSSLSSLSVSWPCQQEGRLWHWWEQTTLKRNTEILCVTKWIYHNLRHQINPHPWPPAHPCFPFPHRLIQSGFTGQPLPSATRPWDLPSLPPAFCRWWGWGCNTRPRTPSQRHLLPALSSKRCLSS